MLKKLFSFILIIVTINFSYSQTKIIIKKNNIPTSLIDFAIADFGSQLPDTQDLNIVIATTKGGGTLGCDSISGVKDAIAIIDRGSCNFTIKAKNAQNAGAIMAIICNNQGGTAFFGPTGYDPSIKIPVIMIAQNDCVTLKANLSGVKAQFKFFEQTVDPVSLYYEDFSKGLNGWTTKGISNARDSFVWSKDGSSKGVLGKLFIDCPTRNNGAMVLDADFLTTQGDTNKIPSGNPPFTRHTSELISPIINLSSAQSVTLKFYQLYAGLNYFDPSVSFSTDGGSTWSTPILINEDIAPNSSTSPGSFIKLDFSNELSGKAQARIKFKFDSDFYGWIIDDVKLLGKSQFDIAIQKNQFFFPFNFATPASQIGTDTSTFSADLANLGLEDAKNIKLKVTVLNSGGTVFHRDSIIIPNLPRNAADTTFFLPKSYVPGKLPAGSYGIVYSVEPGAGSPTDADPTNNTQVQPFIITSDLYSKDDGQNNSSGLRAQNDGPYFFGNIYNTSNDWNANDKFNATQITFGAFIPTADGTLTGKSATIYMAELLPTLDRDFNNLQDKAITDNPTQMKLVGVGSYEFKNAQSETASLTIQEAENFTDKVRLKKNTRYLVGVNYSEGLSKAYQFVESDINYYYIGSLFFANNQWSGSLNAPVVRMRIELATPNDEIVLPETSLQLFPNPTTDYIKATVHFDKPTDVNFTMADINGRLISFQSKKKVTKETYDFDTTALPAGTYLLRISTEEGTKTKKFVVSK